MPGLRPTRTDVSGNLVTDRGIQSGAKTVFQRGIDVCRRDGTTKLDGHNRIGCRAQQGIARERDQEGQHRTARVVSIPQTPQNAEDRDAGVETVQLREALRRELSCGQRALSQEVVFDDCCAVFRGAGRCRGELQEVGQLTEHHGAAGMGAAIAKSKAEPCAGWL